MLKTVALLNIYFCGNRDAFSSGFSSEDKSTKERKLNMWIGLRMYFKCGETNVSVYLYSSVRIIPSPIHSSSHAFHLLIFLLLTCCRLHDARVTDVTWASLLKIWLAVCCQACSNKRTPLQFTLNKLSTASGVNTTNAVLTLLRGGFYNPGENAVLTLLSNYRCETCLVKSAV